MKKATLTIFFLATLLCPSAFAATPQTEAGKLISQAVDHVLTQLMRPEARTPGPQQTEILKDVEKTIVDRIDFEEFSARAVGAKWREFTPDQKHQFITAFSDLLYYTYFGSLLKYSGEQVLFAGEVVSSKGDKVEVKTNFMYKGNPIPINYRAMEKNGKWVVYDIFIESISMVQNYRTQFQDALQKQSPEQVIQRIRAKADETKASAESNIGR